MNLYIVKHKWYKLDHQYDPMENYFATGRSVVMVAALIYVEKRCEQRAYLPSLAETAAAASFSFF